MVQSFMPSEKYFYKLFCYFNHHVLKPSGEAYVTPSVVHVSNICHGCLTCLGLNDIIGTHGAMVLPERAYVSLVDVFSYE